MTMNDISLNCGNEIKRDLRSDKFLRISLIALKKPKKKIQSFNRI